MFFLYLLKFLDIYSALNILILGFICLILFKNFLFFNLPLIKIASYLFKLLSFSLSGPDGILNSLPARTDELKQTILDHIRFSYLVNHHQKLLIQIFFNCLSQ